MKPIVFIILILLYICPTASYAQEKEKKTVLVLYSFGQSYPATAQWDKGFRAEFDSQQDFDITINTEHLDLSKYYDSTYVEKIIDIFNYKYANEQPDLLLTVFEPALKFLLDNRSILFPEVPIVFGGIERSSVNNLEFDKNTIGVHGDFVGIVLYFKLIMSYPLNGLYHIYPGPFTLFNETINN